MEVLAQKPSSPAVVCFKSLIHPKGQPECFLPAARNQELPQIFSIPASPGPPQNPLKNHLRKRCPKALKNDPRASKIDPKIYKNRARGPPAGISDAVLSNPGFDDGCMNFMVFQVRVHPRITKKSAKPSARDILKLHVAIAASRSFF